MTLPPDQTARAKMLLEAGAGLCLDMLCVDRLRQWADNVAAYGSDLTHWTSPSFVFDWLRKTADEAHQTVLDVGALRASIDALLAAHAQQAEEIARLRERLDVLLVEKASHYCSEHRGPCQRSEQAEAECETLRAEVERLKAHASRA